MEKDLIYLSDITFERNERGQYMIGILRWSIIDPAKKPKWNKKMGDCGRFRHFNLIEAIKD